MTRIVISASSYDEDIGGIIVLHKLCHLLRQLGYNAYLKNVVEDRVIGRNNFKGLFIFVYEFLISVFTKYRTNPQFDTPILSGEISDSDIVVYSEGTFGNPLKANNVVRWFLNKPGYFTGHTFYGKGELYFKFDNGLVSNFEFPGSRTSKNILNVVHIPFDIYNTSGAAESREGTAYSVRKGISKKLSQHPEDAVCIDGLNHREIATIFKRVQRFISYDTYSAYCFFAVLCGCEVVVIPDEGISREEWYPDEKLRYGLAYGFDDLQWANDTKHLVLPYRESKESLYVATVENFISESMEYFSLEINDYKLAERK